jgi:carboxypeptidase Q
LLACAGLVPALQLRAQNASAPEGPSTRKTAEKTQEKPSSKPAETDPVARIKDEGLNRSQVMPTLSHLTDVIGPRLTGSPGMKQANEWTRDTLRSWGLQNSHLEAWGPFGRGWSLSKFSIQVVSPQCIPLIAYPRAWSPGLDGTVIAEVARLDAKTVADLDKLKGKLRGKVVMLGAPVDVKPAVNAFATRLTDSDLLTLADSGDSSSYLFSQTTAGGGGSRLTPRSGAGAGADQTKDAPTPPRTGGGPGGGGAPSEFLRKRAEFLRDEGIALLIEPSGQGDGGTLFVAQASIIPGSRTPYRTPEGKRMGVHETGAPKITPQVAVAKEHYNRLARMVEQGVPLKLAIDLSVQFHDDDPMGYNTIAEIPGNDLKDEVVMLGGHMDSWHSGTGATDNAAGVAVAMEAVRIIKSLDLKPRRTIRIALWSGEEQGLLGSRAYVTQHFGKAPPSFGGAASTEKPAGPTPEFEKFFAYYNLDNGTGKIRGVYLQGNEAVRPIFRKWLAPFRDMGASTLSSANTGSTDHVSFDGIGLPGFQFIQDPVEYMSRTHHSNQDLYDRIQPDDMKQASVIMAAFVYQSATIDQKMPRKK